ncbi:MAG: dockerin type I repeat-containing protein [Planctomycetes bacterium]|nr:dockerin type I repeat-containing protein [Planctomycetota bacterium]
MEFSNDQILDYISGGIDSPMERHVRIGIEEDVDARAAFEELSELHGIIKEVLASAERVEAPKRSLAALLRHEKDLMSPLKLIDHYLFGEELNDHDKELLKLAKSSGKYAARVSNYRSRENHSDSSAAGATAGVSLMRIIDSRADFISALAEVVKEVNSSGARVDAPTGSDENILAAIAESAELASNDLLHVASRLDEIRQEASCVDASEISFAFREPSLSNPETITEDSADSKKPIEISAEDLESALEALAPKFRTVEPPSSADEFVRLAVSEMLRPKEILPQKKPRGAIVSLFGNAIASALGRGIVASVAAVLIIAVTLPFTGIFDSGSSSAPSETASTKDSGKPNPSVVNVLIDENDDVESTQSDLGTSSGEESVMNPENDDSTPTEISDVPESPAAAEESVAATEETNANSNVRDASMTSRSGTSWRESFASREQVQGDLNGDGQVTVADAMIIMQMIRGQRTPSRTRADMNDDGLIDTADVRELLELGANEAFK